MSETEARRLCKLNVAEGAYILKCAFGAGHDLPEGARVDVLEFVWDTVEMIESTAMLIIRTQDGPEPTDSCIITTANEVPGQDEAYTLGALTVTDGRITLPVDFVTRVTPNTGDPDLPSGAYEERRAFVVRSDWKDIRNSCERVESTP